MNYLVSKKEFTNLASANEQLSISIYTPTSRAGAEVDNRHGQLWLKNSLKKIKTALKGHNLSDNEIENYLEPVSDLLSDHHFWRNQSDCLVVFLNSQKMWHYTLPIDFEEYTYISDHFYLKPLLSLFNGDGKFFLLNLSLQEVKFYEGSRHSLTKVVVDDLVPQKLEQTVGFDYHEKSLQFRTGQGGEAVALYHGQGSGKDDKEIEVEKFLRAVDKGLMEFLNGDDAPLVLACVDHYFPVYEKVTVYPNLFGQHISGNHQETDPLDLHEMAWPLVEESFQQNRKKWEKRFMDQVSGGKTSIDLKDILPAAMDGRIEALFIQKSTDRFGLYDMVNRSMIIDEQYKENQVSLFNLVALQTWLKGGQVFLVDDDDLPHKGTGINALFRYS